MENGGTCAVDEEGHVGAPEIAAQAEERSILIRRVDEGLRHISIKVAELAPLGRERLRPPLQRRRQPI